MRDWRDGDHIILSTHNSRSKVQNYYFGDCPEEEMKTTTATAFLP